MIQRGNIYLVKKGDPRDPKAQRPVVVVSRQELMDTTFVTVICAPISSKHIEAVETQVHVDEGDGLKHPSAILCDGLISIPKSALTNYRGQLSEQKIQELDQALAVAIGIDDS